MYTASSWSSRRLVASAGVITVCLLAIGIATASLLTPGSADAAPVATAVAGAVEVADAPSATEIGDAVAARREGPFEPAPIEHLTVVHVSVSACGDRSTGSGVVVAEDLILTAAHVVGDAGLVRIDVGGITVTGEVLGVLGDGRDVALVAVDAPMAAPLVPGVAPGAGDPVTMIGHPGGGPRTIVVGAAVDVAPVVRSLVTGDVIGVDATVAVGMSGGPAVDANGDIIGVMVANEQATDTALIVALADLAVLPDAALLPGTCPESA